MQTRSQGNQNLIHYLDHINRLQPRHSQPAPRTPTAMEDQQARPRVIGAGDAPNTHTQRQGIVPPAVPNNNFEIKSGLISMVQGNKFHGLPMEDPLDHLDEFDRLCGLTKINGVSEDGFKLRLFPFSLGDKAHQWEKHLPSGSITTWDECKKAFLAKFFSSARTARLKNEIAGFSQKNGETFSEAWERFKTYTAQCPHHGFSKETLLSTLYRGALPKIRTILDTASNGNFLNKEVDQGWELVENLAQSDGTYSEDYDRSVRGHSEVEEKNRKELKALNDKLDKLLLVHQKSIHFVHEEEQCQIQEGENDQPEEVCYMQNQGGYKGYNNYKPNPNLSYRNTNVANPQDQVYPPQQQGTKPFVQYQNQTFVPRPALPALNPPPGFALQQQQPSPEIDVKMMLHQLLQGQAAAAIDQTKKMGDLKNHIDGSYNDLNNKIETLNSRLKYLENISASSSSTKTTCQLPGKSIQNPKDFANVHVVECTDLRSLPFKKRYATYTEDSVVQEGENADQALGKLQAEKQAPETSLGLHTRSCGRVRPVAPKESPLGQHTRSSGRVKPPTVEAPPISNLNLMLSCPYPQRFKKQILEEYAALVDKGCEEAEAIMSLRDAYNLIPLDQPRLRAEVLKRVEAKESDAEEKAAKQHHECKAIVEKDIITKEKLEDPGSFTLPCQLNQTGFKNALCDLGASVSIMPLSVAKRLGYDDFKPSRLSLVLADRSIRLPHGILEDLPVRIGHVEVPTDFIVLEMNEEPKHPLILGRPFLATAGAIIDVKLGKIELKLGKDLVLKFDIDKDPRKPTTEEQLSSIEEMEQGTSDVVMEKSREAEGSSLPSYIPLIVGEEPPTSQEESMEWLDHRNLQSDDESQTGSSTPEEGRAQARAIRNLQDAVGFLIKEVDRLKMQVAELRSNNTRKNKGGTSEPPSQPPPA